MGAGGVVGNLGDPSRADRVQMGSHLSYRPSERTGEEIFPGANNERSVAFGNGHKVALMNGQVSLIRRTLGVDPSQPVLPSGTVDSIAGAHSKYE